MTRDELYRQIQSVRSQIRTAESDLRTAENKLETLLEFAAKANAKAEAFMESVQRRKRKLSGIDGLLSRMKAAMTYRQKMNDMLTGSDYTRTKNSVDSLLDQVSRQKSQLNQRIRDLDEHLDWLRRRLSQLQYEYDTYPEEEAEDGE